MIEEFMKMLLSLSFSGTCLFLLVMMIVRLARNRLSRRWQYYIWLLVVLRFLVPVTFPNTVTGQLFQNVEQAVAGRHAADSAAGGGAEDIEEIAASKAWSEEGQEDTADKIKNGEGQPDKAEGGGPAVLSEPVRLQEELTVTFEEDASSGIPGGFLLWLFVIWAVGAFGLLMRKITVYQSYMRFLKSGNVEVSDPAMLNLLAEAEEALGIGRTIELYRNPMIASPIMTGFFRPGIVMPDKKMTDKELNCVFTHELVHFKYRDMFYKWLVQVTICVHWFNPFVWLLGKEVNRRCELSCDEKVVGALSAQARKDYGDTLLSFLKREEAYRNPLASITLTEGAEQLIERLGAIMDYRKKTKPVMILTTALTMLLCFFFAGIGAYAGQHDAEPKKDMIQTNDRVQLNDETQQDDTVQTKHTTSKKDTEYSVLYDEDRNTWYILVDGATSDDMPVGGASGGYAIVLVRKSGYASFSFSSYEMKFGFLKRLEAQCQEAVADGGISEAEAELIQEVAVEIAVKEGILTEEEAEPYMDKNGFAEMAEEEQDDASRKVDELKEKQYAYYQRTRYEEPYIIEYGWNLHEEDAQYYLHTEILLEDQSPMTVGFASEAEAWLEDVEAMEAVTKLLWETKQTARSRFGLEMERPFIVRILYLPPENVRDFAKQAYESDNIADFSAVVELLSEEEKESYCERSYEEDDVAFFSIIISETEVDYMTAFLEKCYENNDMTYFSIAAADVPVTAKKALMRRSLQEERTDYYYLLKNM